MSRTWHFHVGNHHIYNDIKITCIDLNPLRKSSSVTAWNVYLVLDVVPCSTHVCVMCMTSGGQSTLTPYQNVETEFITHSWSKKLTFDIHIHKQHPKRGGITSWTGYTFHIGLKVGANLWHVRVMCNMHKPPINGSRPKFWTGWRSRPSHQFQSSRESLLTLGLGSFLWLLLHGICFLRVLDQLNILHSSTVL